jgi:hypothetical protein
MRARGLIVSLALAILAVVGIGVFALPAGATTDGDTPKVAPTGIRIIDPCRENTQAARLVHGCNPCKRPDALKLRICHPCPTVGEVRTESLRRHCPTPTVTVTTPGPTVTTTTPGPVVTVTKPGPTVEHTTIVQAPPVVTQVEVPRSVVPAFTG